MSPNITFVSPYFTITAPTYIAAALDVPITDLFDVEPDEHPTLALWCPECGHQIHVEMRVIDPKFPDHENIRGKEYYK